MPSLGELSESRERLCRLPPRDTPEYATAVWREIGPERVPFARVQLKALGLTEAPRWGTVLRRVRRFGRLCTPDMQFDVQAALDEPDDTVHLVIRPREDDRSTIVCTGAHGCLRSSVSRPHHRLMLETEIVYPLA